MYETKQFLLSIDVMVKFLNLLFLSLNYNRESNMFNLAKKLL